MALSIELERKIALKRKLGREHMRHKKYCRSCRALWDPKRPGVTNKNYKKFMCSLGILL